MHIIKLVEKGSSKTLHTTTNKEAAEHWVGIDPRFRTMVVIDLDEANVKLYRELANNLFAQINTQQIRVASLENELAVAKTQLASLKKQEEKYADFIEALAIARKETILEPTDTITGS